MKKMKLIQSMDECVLNRQQLKDIYGGSGSNSGSRVSNCCNNFCETDNDCCSDCSHCAEIPNWAGKKACSRTK